MCNPPRAERREYGSLDFKDFELSFERWKDLTKYVHKSWMKRLVLRHSCAKMHSNLGSYQLLDAFPKLQPERPFKNANLLKVVQRLSIPLGHITKSVTWNLLGSPVTGLLCSSPAFSLITLMPHHPSVT